MRLAFGIGLTVVLAFSAITDITAQQILLLKHNHIQTRFNLGDEITFELKGSRQTYKTAILAMREFDFVTMQKDTIAYQEISKLKFFRPGLFRSATSTLVASAAIAGLGAALHKPFGDKNPQAIRGMYAVGILGGITGLSQIVMSRKVVRLKINKRLKYISYNSPLYR